MITELQLHNFKCFQHSPIFEFSKINLLTGINGRGKSTILQSLLLLSQSAIKDSYCKTLTINDKFVALGNYDDIKNSETPSNENIEFTIKTIYKEFEYIKICYGENEFDPFVADLISIEIMSNNKILNFDKQGFKIDDRIGFYYGKLICRTQYVSADRLGPVKYVDKSILPAYPKITPRGDNVINMLANDNLPLVNQSLYLGNDAQTVLQQTQEWLSYILEGAKIEIKGKEKDSSILYMLLNNKSNSYNYKPTNIGFGYSYILPIIVAGLIAEPYHLLIVENPEAHLHPRAQSRIAEFLVRVASTGVQVFVESHSEHILNGLRVCALRPDIDIKSTDISILYFNESFTPEKLIIDEKGKIANWPEGFFDQQELDLASIFKYSR